MAAFVKFQIGISHKVVPRVVASTLEAIASQTAAGRPTPRTSIDAYELETLSTCGVVEIDGDFVVSSAKKIGDFDFSHAGRWR